MRNLRSRHQVFVIVQMSPVGNLIANGSAAPSAAVQSQVKILGVTLIGATPQNLHKLLLTLALIVAAFLVTWIVRALLRLALGSRAGTRFYFWARQGVSLVISAVVVLSILSIWFDSPARLATAIGLIGAGLAFALQRVITAVAGYFVILRGKTFNVGDRIVMGGVRGDVIALSFMQTKIMEMGQPPPVQKDDPAMWVKSRQFTGRIVTVTNDKIFDEPVYNYTREFPFMWEEVSLPVKYSDDRARAESILLDAARRHSLRADSIGAEDATRLEHKFGLSIGEIEPRIYWRLTDNWLEMTVRFLLPDHGTREAKDAMSREIIAGLDEAGIGIASATYEVVGLPPLRMEKAGQS